MSDTASRYEAISGIASLCSGSESVAVTLEGIISAVESALPGTSHMSLLLPHGNRTKSNEIVQIPGNASLSTAAATRVLKCATPGPVLMLRGENAWVTPLLSAGTCLGAILSRGVLSDEDKDFLQVVAGLASLLMSSRRFGAVSDSDQAEKRIQELSAIYEISQARDSQTIEDLLSLITEKAAAVMDAQACSLMFKDPQRDVMVIKASFGLSEEVVEETHVAYGEGVAGRVAKTGQPMLLNNLKDDPRFVGSDVVPKPDIVSSICVPLRDEEGLVQGVLNIRRRFPAAMFCEDDVKLFSVFASQAALAISNAQLYGSLKNRLSELSTLYDMSRQLSGSYSLKGASDALFRVCKQVAGSVPTVLLIADPRRGMTVQETSAINSTLRRDITKSIDDRAARWMQGLRQPVNIEAGREQPVQEIRGLVGVLEQSFRHVGLVPLIADDAVIGLLMVGNTDGQRLEQRKVRLLSIAASQAAGIIKNARRYEEQIDQRVLELSALFKLSQRISTAGNLKEALASILDIVRDIVWYDESFIYMVDDQRDKMVVEACRGAGCEHLLGAALPLDGDTLAYWALAERKAFLAKDLSKDPEWRQPSLRSGTVRSLMAIPLIVQDEAVGVLNVHGYAPNLYSEDSVKVLSVIASQTAAIYTGLEALDALTNYTDNILRSIGTGVVTVDKRGKALTWNRAAEEITTISASEIVGRDYRTLPGRLRMSPPERQRFLEVVDRVYNTGESYAGYKYEFVRAAGEAVAVNINISRLRDNDGETLGLVIIFDDITRQIQLEEQMRRISELATTGQFAASIAHELRNPLSSIKGAAQYLRNEYEDHASIREFLDIIIEEVNVLNKSTTEFLDFARPARLNLVETDVNDVLHRTLQFMQANLRGQKVELRRKFGLDVPRIMVDPRQLAQVFRNMFLNALQAMSEGGRLTVTTAVAQDGVDVIIADNGTGIPKDKLEKIFVPFFTTKTKGSGLGLAIARKIVDNHGGRIAVKSHVGKGTTFQIYLPVRSSKAQAATIGVAASVEPDFLRRA